MVASRKIYVSAATPELKEARETVARVLRVLGYDPVWMEPEAPHDDARAAIFREIESCAALVQIVGRSYGAEPPVALQRSGRTSYAQHEALSARQCKMPVWHFITAADFPTQPHPPEDAEHERLQTTYQARVQNQARYWRVVKNLAELEKRTLKLRGPLFLLRRAANLKVAAGLLLVGGLIYWLARATDGGPTHAGASDLPANHPATATPRLMLPATPRATSSLSLNDRQAAAVEMRARGKFAEAEAELREILATRERFLGRDHADTLDTCYELALVLRDGGKRAEALSYTRRLQDVVRRNPGADRTRLLEVERLFSTLQ